MFIYKKKKNQHTKGLLSEIYRVNYAISKHDSPAYQ